MLFLLGVAGTANADGFLDRLRNTDLNEYALGLAVSVSESPYAGAENSTVAYPYLTSFTDSSLSDDWLFIRDGDLGARRITDNGWEFGISGTIRTLGLGNGDTPELSGLNDRKWTTEIGPFVGYHGWPVHIDLQAHGDILGRHNGLAGQLTLSLPLAGERGYIVPSVQGLYYDRDFTDYYFGVSSLEATPARPAYAPDNALNTAIRVRFGYALSDLWLLSGSVGTEFHDSTIKNSPIVDKDSTWSATLGLAYNADVFQPVSRRDEAVKGIGGEFQIAAFRARANTRLTTNHPDGTPGTPIDLEDELGLPKEQTVLLLGANFRLADYHHLELGYYKVERDGQATIQQVINAGGQQFDAGTALSSQFRNDIFWIAYGYSLLNDEQKEFGFVGGIHYTKSRASILSEIPGIETESRLDAPLPVIGLFGSVDVSQHWSANLRAHAFRLDFDRYEGSLNIGSINLRRRIGESFSIGLAYNAYRLELRSSDNNLSGKIEVNYNGPSLFVSDGF